MLRLAASLVAERWQGPRQVPFAPLPAAVGPGPGQDGQLLVRGLAGQAAKGGSVAVVLVARWRLGVVMRGAYRAWSGLGVVRAGAPVSRGR